MGNPTPEIKFREDIEILRGVAILLVFTYHLKIAFVKSGFIGVDIFFVISGFLIAAALKGTTRTEIINFYDRRARRVLPACFVVFLLFFLISPFLFLPFETKKIAESFIGTIVGAPNFVFWLENSYFDELSFRPMLHYWSLGVEIQYYIIFPFLIYLTKGRIPLVFIIFIISFIICILLTKISTKSAFFLTPSRIWEFLAGFFAYRISEKSLLNSFKWRNWVSVVALFAMCITAVVEIPHSEFPGYHAIYPVFFAFTFLLFGLSITGKVAQTAAMPIRFLGRISFSFYLIHYPIIFLFLYSPFSQWETIELNDIFVITIITTILSIISYRFIEVPFRNRTTYNTNKLLTLTAVFFAFAFTVLFVFHKYNYFSNFFPKAERDAFYAVNDYGSWRCTTIEQLSSIGELSCITKSSRNANRTLLLVGDSHMDAIKHLFIESPSSGQTNVRLFKESCLLGTSHCTAKSVFDEAAKHSITDVVLHGAFSDRYDYKELELLASQAKYKNIKIHFIKPIPTYQLSVPKIIFDAERGIAPLSKFIYTRNSFEKSKNWKYRDFSRKAEHYENVFFYDTTILLCSEYCLIRGEDGVYYHDSHHLSTIGSKRLSSLVDDIIAN